MAEVVLKSHIEAGSEQVWATQLLNYGRRKTFSVINSRHRRRVAEEVSKMGLALHDEYQLYFDEGGMLCISFADLKDRDLFLEQYS